MLCPWALFRDTTVYEPCHTFGTLLPPVVYLDLCNIENAEKIPISGNLFLMCEISALMKGRYTSGFNSTLHPESEFSKSKSRVIDLGL